jgi:hypothetical protein
MRHKSQFLDLIVEDDRLNVYAGELEVRPPGAPTTEGLGWVVEADGREERAKRAVLLRASSSVGAIRTF